ncbi:hypothetical protein PG994_011504 [Apiospora phragmitis]|uniref:Uncharacterized protein n=1 Tax=Apiospora phragmitis TaxID=2905665 RepID=A0ABR1TVM1_9PEZI
MTRPKRSLIVIGDSDTVQNSWLSSGPLHFACDMFLITYIGKEEASSSRTGWNGSKKMRICGIQTSLRSDPDELRVYGIEHSGTSGNARPKQPTGGAVSI